MATRQRKCAARGCQQRFVPVRDNQLYHDIDCKNREAQRRLRERYRRAIYGSKKQV